MLQSFCQFITENRLFGSEERVILAVSGGIDSICMAGLFSEAKYNFAMAHCNFGLRGEESEADEEFVRKAAKKYKVPVFVQHFHTAEFAEKEKISIQMAARELRYAWFNELLLKEKYDKVAVAHHRNDVLETMLLNLVRGTGIAGLHGISAQKGKIVRPMLFADREQIMDYVAEKNLGWREDSSNESNKYSRNLLRNEVVPLLKKLNPDLENTITQTTEKISAAEKVYQEYIEKLGKELFRVEGNVHYFSLEKFSDKDRSLPVLFELLKEYGFGYAVVREIFSSLEATPGKKFEAPAYLLVKDRDQLVITSKNLSGFMSLSIQEGDSQVETEDLKLNLQLSDSEKFKISSSRDTACIDLEKLKFPLQLRKWKEGDWFCPLGMNKKKKLSDFLIDQKVPLNLKDKIYVLTSNGSIAWVVNYRVDERFKITEKTEKILSVKCNFS
ncbi:MAG: tRNA lysidine(34) synthetase TilS [Cytophagaceae bacterium]